MTSFLYFRFIQINNQSNFNKKGNSEKRDFFFNRNFIFFLVDRFVTIHVRQKHRLSSLLNLQLVTLQLKFYTFENKYYLNQLKKEQSKHTSASIFCYFVVLIIQIDLFKTLRAIVFLLVVYLRHLIRAALKT